MTAWSDVLELSSSHMEWAKNNLRNDSSTRTRQLPTEQAE